LLRNDLELRTPPGVLGRIVAQTLSDVAQRAEAAPRATLEAELRTDDVRDFVAALRAPGLSLIAEFKPRSPSRGDIRPGASPEFIAGLYAPYASAISVLCDRPFFGGHHDNLQRVRAVAPAPALCKDFIVTEYQVIEARAAGADALLLMASLLPPASLERLLALARSVGLSALVEVHDAQELREVLDTDARIVGVNSRDLKTLEIDLDHMLRLLDTVPGDRVRVGESGLKTAADLARLKPRADAALIGTRLMGAPDPTAAIQALGFEPCR
jgi:indole-3-glycerol phosphate synthase